jgi:hypothetical protein
MMMRTSVHQFESDVKGANLKFRVGCAQNGRNARQMICARIAVVL